MAHQYYHYTPSLPAGVIALLLFLLSTAVHSFQLVKNRTWYFIPFIIGGFFEWIGYIGRLIASNEEYGQWTLGPYVLQSLLLLLGPTLFAASVYMILGRIILLTDGERYSLIPTKWLTKVFVFGDVLSFLLQAAGGGLLASAKTEDAKNIGQDVITGGLLVQVLFFGMFIVVAALFNFRVARHPGKAMHATDKPWQLYLNVLYCASGLIMIRCVFRVVEYIQGNDGYIVSHEVFLYIFDTLLMLITMVLFNIWHPSKVVSGKSKILNARNNASMERSFALEPNGHQV